MENEENKIRMNEFYKYRVADIMAAREKARFLHTSKDIKASGNEVENSIRQVFKKMLPDLYDIGHGHIMDSKLACSPQLDLIIFDKKMSFSLFKSEDETQYLAYESIYAVGEIKTSYNKKSFQEYIDKIKKIKTELNRKSTPSNYIAPTISVAPNLLTTNLKNSKNPFFSFMIFVDSSNFKTSDIKELYSNIENSYLPNVVCFIDKGIICNAIIVDYKIKTIINHPELFKKDENQHWIFKKYANNELHFAWLYALIMEHLTNCILMPPHILDYHSSMTDPYTAEIIL